MHRAAATALAAAAPLALLACYHIPPPSAEPAPVLLAVGANEAGDEVRLYAGPCPARVRAAHPALPPELAGALRLAMLTTKGQTHTGCYVVLGGGRMLYTVWEGGQALAWPMVLPAEPAAPRGRES